MGVNHGKLIRPESSCSLQVLQDEVKQVMEEKETWSFFLFLLSSLQFLQAQKNLTVFLGLGCV